MKIRHYPIVYVLLLLILAILVGDKTLEYPLRFPDHYTYAKNPVKGFVVRVSTPPTAKGKTVRMEGEVLEITTTTDTLKSSGKILLFFAADSHATSITYGDVLFVRAKPTAFQQPNQKGEFDAKSYYRHKRIYAKAFVRTGRWVRLAENQGFAFQAKAYQCKAYVKSLFHQLFPEGGNAALLSALFLSDKQHLDEDLLQTYRHIGLAHVLCVSGLHVGMIATAISFFLSFFFYGSRLRLNIRFVLSLIGVFGFCFIVGWQPSVLRAALMFSFVIFGGIFSRATDRLNNLAVAAFILLVIEPLWLFDIGFQLSFLAVAGICLFLPLTHLKAVKKWRFGRGIYQTAVVSIGAQWFTLPLCLYYFHQLPLLSIVANILILPIVHVTVITILLSCLLLPFQIGWSALNVILSTEISWMNAIAKGIHRISFSYIDHVFIPSWVLWIMYAVILVFSGAIYYWCADKEEGGGEDFAVFLEELKYANKISPTLRN